MDTACAGRHVPRGTSRGLLPEEQGFFSGLLGKVFELQIKPEQLGEVERAFLVSSVSVHAGQMLVRVITDLEPNPYSFSQVPPTLEDVYLYQFADEMGRE